MNKRFLKTIALILAIGMLLSFAVACTPKDKPDDTTAGSDNPNNPSDGLGTSVSGHKLGHFTDDGKTYTYRTATSAQLPSAWNFHSYETSDATTILNYTSDSLYTYEWTADFSTYAIVPSIAADYATDVTSKYVGKYGIEEGDVNKAWSIPIRDGVKFDNGETLDANSFVASMKLLLNPKAQNVRANDMYNSTFKIYNAENYLKQGSYALGEFVSSAYGDEEYVDPANFTTAEDGTLQCDGKDVVLDLSSGGNWGNNSLADYAGAGYLDSVADAYAALEAAADDNGWVKLTADLLRNLQDCIAALQGYSNVDEYAADCEADGNLINGINYAYIEFEEMAFLGKNYGDLEYDGNVGFFAPSANELVIVIVNPMKDNYYLRSALASSFFLVYAPMYEQCIDESTGVYTNTYGTSIDTYVGFGPYKLVEFVEGSYVKFDRNMNWHGYNDGEYIEGTYMTDSVLITYVEQDATRMEMFLKGETDGIGLTAATIGDYLGSDYTYYTDSESTWFIVMNPDYDHLKAAEELAEPQLAAGNKVIKTVLNIQDFRKALSYSVNRQDVINATIPTMKPAAWALSSVLVADPDTGVTYRSLDEAKDAVLSFWGLSDAWGEGKEYADRDEAIESITGYDPSGAKTLFDSAYDQAVEAGYITAEDIASGNWEVQIIVGRPSENAAYTNGAEALATAWMNGVKGTKFEGHLSVRSSDVLGDGWANALKEYATVDVLFLVGWSGDPMDPYGLAGCFVNYLCYDQFTDKNNIFYDVTIDGKTLRASYYAWLNDALSGTEITAQVIGADGNPTGETVKISAGSNDPVSVRTAVMAAGEEAILALSNLFPLSTNATASLRGMRINFITDEYNVLMGFGGIEWHKYSMDDAEFASYVTSQGGTLNYK